MRILKNKTCTDSIRKITNDEKTEVIGIIGTVGDLLDANLFTVCTADRAVWAFCDATGTALFEDSKEEILKTIGYKKGEEK